MLLALIVASALGDRIADRARDAAGLASVRQLSRADNDDCSGFARAIYRSFGLDLGGSKAGENGVTSIRRIAAGRGALRRRPHPGDLVFFRNTTARGGLTHIGIVDGVHGSQVTFVHRAGRGIVRSRLDLRHPRLRARNDYIRRSPRKLAGELLAGFAAPEPLAR